MTVCKIKIRLCHTNWATNLEFISKTWCCWHAATLHERYPSNCLRGKGGAFFCVLDARPCCRMIVWLRRMINVMLKGSEGKSLRTCPPTVMVNKDSLDVGLLKIQEKVEHGGLIYLFWPIQTHFLLSYLLMNKHSHLVEYQQTFLHICAFQLVLKETGRPVEPSKAIGIPHV